MYDVRLRGSRVQSRSPTPKNPSATISARRTHIRGSVRVRLRRRRGRVGVTHAPRPAQRSVPLSSQHIAQTESGIVISVCGHRIHAIVTGHCALSHVVSSLDSTHSTYAHKRRGSVAQEEAPGSATWRAAA